MSNEDLNDLVEGLSKAKISADDEQNESGSVPDLLSEISLKGISDYIAKTNDIKIITMAGAGISTSAGIPDFRSPGSGLYDNLQEYNLPTPQAIFDINYFRLHPEPFFRLARELWPGSFQPTPCHHFIKLLSEKGVLLRHFTQNIDGLERIAGVPNDLIVEAHGTFESAHCTTCQKEYPLEWMKVQIFSDSGSVPTCEADDCVGVVKPDIVFFGEAMPMRFIQAVQADLPQADLLIVMGTSLMVQPFASLVERVPDNIPRLYINREYTAASMDPIMRLLGMMGGFKFGDEDNFRDVFHKGDCDDGCKELADNLGWKADLEKLIASGKDIDTSKYVSPKKPPQLQDASGANNDAAIVPNETNTDQTTEKTENDVPVVPVLSEDKVKDDSKSSEDWTVKEEPSHL